MVQFITEEDMFNEIKESSAKALYFYIEHSNLQYLTRRRVECVANTIFRKALLDAFAKCELKKQYFVDTTFEDGNMLIEIKEKLE